MHGSRVESLWQHLLTKLEDSGVSNWTSRTAAEVKRLRNQLHGSGTGPEWYQWMTLLLISSSICACGKQILQRWATREK